MRRRALNSNNKDAYSLASGSNNIYNSCTLNLVILLKGSKIFLSLIS